PWMLDEPAPFRLPEALVDVAVDGVTYFVPARERSRERASIRQADSPVDRHPTHHPRVEELTAPASHFPDTLVSLPPVVAQPVDKPENVHPRVVSDRRAVLVIQVHRVHQLAVDVERKMRVSVFANADRPRVHVALEVIQRLLAHRKTAVERVHDLE